MAACCSRPCNTHMKVCESEVRLEACRMGRWVASGIPVWVLLLGSCMCRCDWCPLGTGCSCTHAGWARDYQCADSHRSTAIVTTVWFFTKYATTWSKQPGHKGGHSCPSSTKIMNAWNSASITLYISTVCCNCKDYFNLRIPTFEKCSQI
jgi:hypothetical protein